MTTKTNTTVKSRVGTVRKSVETSVPTWLARHVRRVCEGGIRWRTRYLETVACEIARPNFEHQRAMRSDPAEEAGEDEDEHGGHHPRRPAGRAMVTRRRE